MILLELIIFFLIFAAIFFLYSRLKTLDILIENIHILSQEKEQALELMAGALETAARYHAKYNKIKADRPDRDLDTGRYIKKKETLQ